MSFHEDVRHRVRPDGGARVRPLWKRYEPGEQLGLSTLVAPLPEPGRWVVLCRRCERTRAVYVSGLRQNVEDGSDGACDACRVYLKKPCLCSCGRTKRRFFKMGQTRWCGRCDRRRHRNGVCRTCGAALASYRGVKRCRAPGHFLGSRLPAHAPSSSRATQECA